MSLRQPTSRSFFLELPTELRLQIYDYALHDTNSITITSAAISGDDPTAPDFIPRTTIPGLPPNHVPLIRSHFDPSLLSIINPITLPQPPDETNSNGSARSSPHAPDILPHPTPLALLQTNKHIYAELTAHIRFRLPHASRGGLALYLTYPHGLLVLKAICPYLLCQARCVYISGYHTLKVQNQPNNSSTSSASTINATGGSSSPATRPRSRLRLRFRLHEPLPPHSHLTTTTAHLALGTLARTLLPPAPTPLFRKLELRVFYPDESAYSSIWGADNSPVVQALRNICGGNIDMEVWRGRRGTGVVLVARPNTAGRVVSTVWRRLGESVEESERFFVCRTCADE
ncbi:hypothetical protein K432DRAFT_363265 [Lepidopterella palustris CBS 459.81]|uniref:F-box domain-containing protein n=1 Tax=Lepidopterella palustris CBS 459.81 TaxID=1314670 RepID=A0A8E2DZS3_9PEZI|nr:hypothetical protein K432DRAFT_363265 [Lepidopterella palustris CBS 459.81]